MDCQSATHLVDLRVNAVENFTEILIALLKAKPHGRVRDARTVLNWMPRQTIPQTHKVECVLHTKQPTNLLKSEDQETL